MNHYTKEDIIRIVEEEDVQFIRLQFTDMYGNLKNIAVTPKGLMRALANKYKVDCSYIAGVTKEGEPDMFLYPDPDTFIILPWRPQEGKVARMICDLYRPDGTPLCKSTRHILKQAVAAAREEGYTCMVVPECEFFLYHTDDHGMPTTVTHERAGYLDIGPVDRGENARRDIVLKLEEIGFDVESSHHETAPAQHEIDFYGREMTEMADCIMTFKMAVRSVAKLHGLHATFMPKPRTDCNGSGMHVGFSLFKNGVNIFDDPEGLDGLSQEAYYFIGGLLKHSCEMALITNPLVNSYKRLVPGYEAPTEVSWTHNNNISLIKVQGERGFETNIEMRSPDSASNPYLVFAVCLAAGLDGIRNKIVPGEAVEIRKAGENGAQIKYLPADLKEAIELFEESDWIKEVLGEEFAALYLEGEKRQWLEYAKQVTPWEVEQYMYRI